MAARPAAAAAAAAAASVPGGAEKDDDGGAPPAAAAAAAAAAMTDEVDEAEREARDFALLQKSKEYALSPVSADALIPDDPRACIGDAALNRAMLYSLLPLWKRQLSTDVHPSQRWDPNWKLKINYPIARSVLERRTSARHMQQLLNGEAIIVEPVSTMEAKQYNPTAISHYVLTVYDSRKTHGVIWLWDPLGHTSSRDGQPANDMEKLTLLLATRYAGKMRVRIVVEATQSDGFHCADWASMAAVEYLAYAARRDISPFTVAGTAPTIVRDLSRVGQAAASAERKVNERYIAAWRAFLRKLTQPSRVNPHIERQFGIASDHSAFLSSK